MSDDVITRLRNGWAAELADLDVDVMATVARVNRLASLLRRAVDERLAAEGSNLGEFDVLAALRRGGSPFRAKPSELARQLMLSPSGMTHRIDLLEDAGFVERVADPASRRTAPVQLTDSGLEASERLVRAVVAVEAEVLDGLDRPDRVELDRILGALLGSIERRGRPR